jgi:diacylglycerol kinase family enzyme
MAVSAQQVSTNDEPYRNRRIALVLNGQAGGLLGQPQAGEELAEKLAASGAEIVVIPPERGTLPERMRAARETGAACVAVAGGDGTIACAAAALAFSEVSLGLIPSGTMNLLAKDLHIEPGDVEAALETLAHGQTRVIDVAAVGGDIFLCASMLGTPARLSRHREAGRQRGNGLRAWAGFGRATLRALSRNRSIRVVLRADDRDMKVRTPSITITVNRLDDDTARLFGRSDLCGGVLGVYLVRRSSALRQLLLLARTVITGRLRTPEIDFFTTRTLVVESADTAMHVLLDGELRLIKPPLRYEIQPGALRVIVPHGR